MIPVNANGVPIGEIPFVRSGLLGFVGPVSTTHYIISSCVKPGSLNMQDTDSAFCPLLPPSQGSLIFVVGKIEGLLMVSSRRHNADDLVATALAVEPVKTVYRGR